MTRDLIPERRSRAEADPRDRTLRAERAEALAAILMGGLAGLDFSPERWLDRLEGRR